MLRHARDEDVIISVVLDMNDNKIHPEAASEDERRFLRYAVARFSAFSNITWDLGDDLEGYRSDQWTHDTGSLIEQWDPYRASGDQPSCRKPFIRTAPLLGSVLLPIRIGRASNTP